MGASLEQRAKPPGFAGKRCNQCDLSIPGNPVFPSCEGSFLAANWPILAAVGGAVVLLGGMFFFARWRNPTAENGLIMIVALAIADFVSDALFVVSVASNTVRAQNNSTTTGTLTGYVGIPAFAPYVALAVVAGPVVIALAIAIGLVFTSTSPEFGGWCRNPAYQGSIVLPVTVLLSSSNLDLLPLLTSRLFGIGAFAAPIIDFKEKVMKVSWILVFLEDIPQVIVQVWILTFAGQNKRDFVTFFALLMSILSILFTLVSRILLCVASRHRKPVDTPSPPLSKENKFGSQGTFYDNSSAYGSRNDFIPPQPARAYQQSEFGPPQWPAQGNGQMENFRNDSYGGNFVGGRGGWN
ncbi:hypothetical protein BJ742DRAFT_777899 [Cladochytrium replicatum]|nr:hypothetical protein BJ742DRAFT_777899 [Cladochytrium replicatum]